MGDTQTNLKIVKMKLFAVLALAVVSRQVNQYGNNEVVIGGACTGDGSTDCGLTNTECTADKCACKADFEAIEGDKKNCAAPVEGPALDAECTTDGPKCGGNQECKASADDAKILTCQCEATHEAKDGKCEPLTTDGSAAFYSVATAFMALILA